MSTLRSGDPLPEGVKNADRPPIEDWDTAAAPEGIRIQKVMAAAGVASRRVAENMIAQGDRKSVV